MVVRAFKARPFEKGVSSTSPTASATTSTVPPRGPLERRRSFPKDAFNARDLTKCPGKEVNKIFGIEVEPRFPPTNVDGQQTIVDGDEYKAK